MTSRPKVRPWSGVTSIRNRVSLSMFYAAALIVPVVIISLLYLRRMNNAVSLIVDRDIEIMHIADRLSLRFAEARRHEKNYILYGDAAYLGEAMAALRYVSRLGSEATRLDPGLIAHTSAIRTQVRSYQVLAESLVRLPRPEPGRTYLTPSLSQLREQHERLLRLAAAATDSAERDSLVIQAARLASDLALPYPGYRELNDAIRAIEAAINAQTDSITLLARRRIAEHRHRTRQLAAWGQRNIVTILLVVLVILTWLIIVLPRRVVLPIKRIANALDRVEDGDLDVRIKPRSKDELGRLAAQLNRAFGLLREQDERKVNRILQLERRFKLLGNDVMEGVLVVDGVPNVVYANPAIEELLGCRSGEAPGRRLKDFPSLDFLLEPVERVLAGSTSQQTTDFLSELPGSVVCIEALRDRAGAVTGALIVISRPSKPAEPDSGREADEPGDRVT